MKKYLIISIAILFILSFTSHGYCDTYVSKKNPAHTIEYQKISSWAGFGQKVCSDYSLQRPGVICYIPSGFYGGHYWLNGKMVDSKMDELAEQKYLRKIESERAAAEKSQKADIVASIVIVISLILLILAGIGIWAGWTDRMIFFHGMPDVIFSFLITIIAPVSAIIILQMGANNQVSEWDKQLVAWSLLLGMIMYHVVMSFQHASNKFLGICVLFGRVLISIVGISVLFSGPGKRKDDPYGHHAVADTIAWMALLTGVVFFIRRLINKDRVLNKISDMEVEEALKIQYRE